MPLYPFSSVLPILGEDVYIAPSADIIGNVILGDNASVWFQCVLRGDLSSITIGAQTNIQDLSMIHVNANEPVKIGKRVTVGHQCNLHSCTIGDHSLIGIGSTLLDGVVVGQNCLVAAGSLLPPGKHYPAGSFIMGAPARVVRELTPEEATAYGALYTHYTALKALYCEKIQE